MQTLFYVRHVIESVSLLVNQMIVIWKAFGHNLVFLFLNIVTIALISLPHFDYYVNRMSYSKLLR